MFDPFKLFEFIHILTAAVLFGAGLGIAFFMFKADRSGDVATIAGTARIVVFADFLFTAPAIVLQPLTGMGMVGIAGISMGEQWISGALTLYAIVVPLWIVAIWAQIQIRNIADTALAAGTALPPRYRRLMRIWFWFSWPALLGVVAIFFLMVDKPEIW